MPGSPHSWIAAGLFLAACGAGPASPSIGEELVGSWRLVESCFYETLSPTPCELVPDGRRLLFEPDGSVSSSQPSWRGRYRLEARPLDGEREEVLIHLPEPSIPAQLWFRGDTLLLSWAYIDGGEERYVRDAAAGG